MSTTLGQASAEHPFTVIAASGLPDLATRKVVDGGSVFRPFDRFYGADLFVPDHAVIADHDGGRAVTLDVVRGADPSRPPAPYGVLVVRLRPPAPPAGACGLLPRSITGYLRDLVGPPAAVIDELAGAATAWRDWDHLELRWHLTYGSASALGEAMKLGLLAGVIHLGLSVPVVAPRADARVRFDPGVLVDRLVGQLPVTTVDELISFLTLGDGRPLVSVDGAPLDGDVAYPVAVRLLDRLASPQPQPRGGDPAWGWPAPGSVGSADWVWDLSQPEVVDLCPVMSVGTVTSSGPDGASFRDAVTIREVDAQPTGTWPVVVDSTLPCPIAGVELVSARLVSPASPPRRPQPAEASVTMCGADPYPVLQLRLSPLEPQQGLLSAVVVVRRADGAVVLEGPPRPHAGPLALIRPEDLPVSLARIVLEPALAEDAADVRVRVAATAAGSDVGFDVHLDHERPRSAVALPDEPSTFVIEATSATGETVRASPCPAGDILIDRGLFAEFGGHRIDVSAEQLTDSMTMMVQLAPERDTTTPALLTLSAAHPSHAWGYAAPSPFRAGYRFHVVTDGVPGEWSSPRSPFESLVLATPVGGRDG